jgi:peptide deformylase
VAIRTIARMGEPILRDVASAVTEGERKDGQLAIWITDLVDTMRAAHGAGLAAPQIFIPKRVCVIEVSKNPRYPDFPEIPLLVLVNPRLTPIVSSQETLPEKESITIYEGCLSVPGMRGRVSRPRKVRVQAEDASGNSLDFTWEGAAAAIVQHETDHLLGSLFIDRADSRSMCFTEEYQRYVALEDRVVDGAVPKRIFDA